jgi:hypothetical protein
MSLMEELTTLQTNLKEKHDTLCRATVHPRFGTHAQATLRWSTTDPPMAQVPGAMEVLFAPSHGYGFFRYDWSALHLWLTAAYADDTRLLTTLKTGADLHTSNVVDLFGYPTPPDLIDPHKAANCEAWRSLVKWEGKDDNRRTFAKRFLYRVLKGGDVTQPPAGIPMTLFGGSSTGFVQASRRWALANAKVMAWQQAVRAEVSAKGMVHTAWGKRRVFSNRDQAAQRGAIDFLCQGTEAEILNETILLTCAAFPPEHVRFCYQRHDCIIWEVAHSVWNDATLNRIAAIATRPITIYKHTFNLHADFHTRYNATDKKTSWTSTQRGV